ncbi:peptide-methionine (S)-S-oxide reductase MsrA [Rhodoferax sp. GW822-FHT02A01]|uniref:peptide-methionine (S)-S-oxide reductase MsrA n=1 Tax=Rhodoferax sp. GW822-FHT02A01 TaxID=3141537 RepID=UPI00315DE588
MSKQIPNPSAQSARTGNWPFLAITVFLLLTMLYLGPAAKADKARSLPPPNQEIISSPVGTGAMQDSVVFAGGCFWGIQAVFQHTKGVLNAVSGYAGGKASQADYETVSGGGTGHAEAVQVTFDPQQVSYAQLLQIYFSVAHDPTQWNRQYPDVGSQYRSAIFYRDDRQKSLAQRYIDQLDSAKVFEQKIVTTVNRLDGFYPAERYHQNYATAHPESPYIVRFDLPKVENLKSTFPSLYRDMPVLVPQ